MRARLRARYGAGPLHLLATLASFALAGAAIVRWFDSGSDVVKILAWFAAAIVVHDLVLLPLYSLLDRVALGAPPPPDRAPDRTPARGYVRVPALLSALLLVVFLPAILRLGGGTYHAASGLNQDVYLGRWLAASGALFAASGVAFVLRGALRRPRRARPRAPASPPRSPPGR